MDYTDSSSSPWILSQNKYIYAADDPMRYVDPTGHMLAAAPGGGGTASTPTCTTSPDVCASESGANAASLVTVSPGVSAKPPDVALTQGGNDQYTNQIVSGTESYITRSQVNAWLVTIALGTSAIDLGIVTIGLIEGALPSFGATIPLAAVTGFSALALGQATEVTIVYDAQAGPEATPGGAISHFADSAGAKAEEDLAKTVWDWCAGFGVC